jgi:hypothetical protein
LRPSRWVSGALALLCVALLTSIPILFRAPPSTIRRRGRLLELAVPVSRSDTVSTGWNAAALDSAAESFHRGLALPPQPSESLAVGAHSLYPYGFLTVRSDSSLTVALKPPWPPGPVDSRRMPNVAAVATGCHGECLVYTLSPVE